MNTKAKERLRLQTSEMKSQSYTLLTIVDEINIERYSPLQSNPL